MISSNPVYTTIFILNSFLQIKLHNLTTNTNILHITMKYIYIDIVVIEIILGIITQEILQYLKTENIILHLF